MILKILALVFLLLAGFMSLKGLWLLWFGPVLRKEDDGTTVNVQKGALYAVVWSVVPLMVAILLFAIAQ